ncbi:uncharacterized protein LOC143470631 isoform X2 [Clavelina lepadiformis]|uniref:uncharacterized protein LOC143470631 isoform X2 n=1 Tax=Clavelina lepadiformis TaxID=159417 RepID=UPI00404198FF
MSGQAQEGSSQDVVKIVKEENGCFKFDLEALKSVLLQEIVTDLPVAIYSIAGTFRKGKSFLLNLFVRYWETGELCNDIQKDAGDDIQEDVVNGPFRFQGGVLKKCTEGIFILKKPMMITTKTHRKVAVFLMDTQGLFDHSTSQKVSSLILGISFLLSSYQIYNLSSGIDSQNLETIYKFAEFAKSVKDINTLSSPFQAFMFLIRDWKNLEYPYGFTKQTETSEAHSDYLEDVLEYKGCSEEHKDIRQLLRETFSNMSCFLLPSPGEVVETLTSRDFSCSLHDVSLSFRQQASQFFQYLCDEENIVLKKFENEEVTCRQLYNYAVHYDFILAKGLVTSVDSFVKAKERAQVDNRIHKLVCEYRHEMDLFPVEILWLEHTHFLKMHKYLSKYEDYPCSDKALKRKGYLRIELLIQQQFKEIKTKREMDLITEKCFKFYEDKLLHWEGIDPERFKNDHMTWKKECMQIFAISEKPGGKDYHMKERKKLETKINQLFQRNKIRLDMELVFKEVLEEYTARLKTKSYLNLDTVLRTKHRKLIWEILEKIEGKLPPGESIQVFEKVLIETETVYDDVKKRNLKWRIGAGIIGTIFGSGALALSSILLSPLGIFLSEATLASLVYGGVEGSGTSVKDILTALFGPSNFKMSLVRAGLLSLKIALPNAAALMDEEVFLSAMTEQECNKDQKDNVL